MRETCITGMGIVTAGASSVAEFANSLFSAENVFGYMQRSGRAQETDPFIGAEIQELPAIPELNAKQMRSVSLTGHLALNCVSQAWKDASLGMEDPTRIGLIVGGSNLNQREIALAREKTNGNLPFLNPGYGLSFMDTDLCGLVTQTFGIHGPSFTVGGASASGLVSLIQAHEAVLSGRVDFCIAVGGMMDLSAWECQAFRSLGAMGSAVFKDEPHKACRPMDAARDGFIFGESCAALVVERPGARGSRSVRSYARLVGASIRSDANRQPSPSQEGECAVLRDVMKQADILPSGVDYVNLHASGSRLGDEVELSALKECGLDGAYINTTKSITGHGLTSAGAVETVACLVQMDSGRLHPCRNLDEPSHPEMHWVNKEPLEKRIDVCAKISLGFGGINAAICLKTER